MSFDAQPHADELSSNDEKLTAAEFNKDTYRAVASRETLDAIAAALTANGHTVEVVTDKAAALEAAKLKLSVEKTVMFAGSGTLS